MGRLAREVQPEVVVHKLVEPSESKVLLDQLFALSREAAELAEKTLSAKPLSRGNQVNRRLLMNITLLFVLRFGTSPGSRRSCFPVSQYFFDRFRPQKTARCVSVGIERSGHRDYGRVNRLEITPFPSPRTSGGPAKTSSYSLKMLAIGLFTSLEWEKYFVRVPL